MLGSGKDAGSQGIELIAETSSLMSLGLWKMKPPCLSLGLMRGTYNNCDEAAEAKYQEDLW